MQKMICQGGKTQRQWTGNVKVLLRLIFAVYSLLNSNIKQWKLVSLLHDLC